MDKENSLQLIENIIKHSQQQRRKIIDEHENWLGLKAFKLQELDNELSELMSIRKNLKKEKGQEDAEH